MNFTALDFETATGKRSSACAIGIVTVEDGKITDEYHSLIQPPENDYFGMNIAVHGIRPQDTLNAPTFMEELRGTVSNNAVDVTLVDSHGTTITIPAAEFSGTEQIIYRIFYLVLNDKGQVHNVLCLGKHQAFIGYSP